MNSKRPSWKWFGVKTAYRLNVTGKPRATDDAYTAKNNMIEERIVIFKARNSEEAVSLSKNEAKKYITDLNFKNAYGETVRWKFLEVCETFEMHEPPEEGAEVFSSTRLVDKKLKDKELIFQMFGPDELDDDYEKRMRFIKGEILRELTD